MARHAGGRRNGSRFHAWTQHFCPPPKLRAWRAPGDRLVIAYLAAKFVDPGDAAAVAAVARAHDRERVRVIGYGCGAQSWDENAALRGAFDAWQDVGTLDGATLARYVAKDEVGVVVDASGFAMPQGLQALARVTSAIRVSWLGNPGALLAPIYDVRIAASAGSDVDWCIDGAYPVLPPIVSPVRVETPRTVPHFRRGCFARPTVQSDGCDLVAHPGSGAGGEVAAAP